MPDPREAELRDRVRSILAANRELGSGYEDAAIEQIVDLVQGRAPRRPRPAPVAAPPTASGRWHPLWVVAAVAAAVIVGLPLLRVAVGVLAGMVDVFAWVLFALALVFVLKLFRRVTRGMDSPRAYDVWEDERGHRWRRVH